MNKNCDQLLRDVQAKSFLAHDILLYLDTHPEDREAFAAYQDALNDRYAAVRAYEQQARSLQPDAMRRQGGYDWLDGKFPWQ